MAISNSYKGERRAGAVGVPLPGAEVALFDESRERICTEDSPGEIRVKGNNVFLEYWDNPDATAESFKDGWFCTGDMAVLEVGYYRIMWRSSIDIIKSGSYKLSALEIEGALLNHENISECAVLGIPDNTWEEAVCAVLVLESDTLLSIEELRSWCAEKMSPYKIPKSIYLLDSLPRNAMGKATKPAIRELLDKGMTE